MTTNYVTEESYNTYIDYLALKKHFSSDYDYHKYNGKIRASRDAFQTRNDVFFFYKLSKMPEQRNLMVSNMVKKPDIWVRDLCEDNAYNIYLEWKKKIDGLTYHITSDLNKLNENYKVNFEVPSNGQYPILLILYFNKKISLETFTVLSNISNTLDYWTNTIVDKTIAPDAIRLSRKYFPFLNIDEKKFKKVIKERFFIHT